MSSEDVDAWLATTQNPKKAVIAAVRVVVMSDGRMEEAIKWRAPAFTNSGVMAYFHWSAKEFASLIFPAGSQIPGEFELLAGTRPQRMIRFDTTEAVDQNRDELLAIVDAWCSRRE